MKRPNVFLYFLSAFIATGTLVCFIALPLRLYGPIWQGYRVLAVPASSDPEAVVSAAEQVGISGTVSELSIANRFSVVQTGGHSGFPYTDENRYNQWFQDENGTLRYFYIPYRSFFRFIKLYFSLYRSGIAFYLEPALAYDPVKLSLALLLFLYCLWGSRKKMIFTAAALSFLFYAFGLRSSLSLTTALLSILSAAYWIEAFDNEITIPWKQLKERIQCNLFMIVLPAASLLSAILDGLLPLLFFLMTLTFSGAALFSVYSFLQLRAEYKDKYRAHPSLKIFVMHPQSWSQFWNTRYAVTATVLCGCLLFTAALLPFAFSTNRLNRTVKILSIPHPVNRYAEPLTAQGFFTAQALRPPAYLPDLSSYIQDCWYTAAMPYFNVHEALPPLTPDMQIRFDFFREGNGGKLHREEKVLYQFNTDFVLEALQHSFFALLPLERMLLAQGGFIPAVHRTVRLFTLSRFASFFINLGALLFPCILIIMAKIR